MAFYFDSWLLPAHFVGGFINGIHEGATTGITNPANGAVLVWSQLSLVVVGLFQMKSDLEDYYNTEEPINLAA